MFVWSFQSKCCNNPNWRDYLVSCLKKIQLLTYVEASLLHASAFLHSLSLTPTWAICGIWGWRGNLEFMVLCLWSVFSWSASEVYNPRPLQSVAWNVIVCLQTLTVKNLLYVDMCACMWIIFLLVFVLLAQYVVWVQCLNGCAHAQERILSKCHDICHMWTDLVHYSWSQELIPELSRQ